MLIFPSMSFLRTENFVGHQSRLNACLTLSWKDKSFQPRSLVALFEPKSGMYVAHAGGRKYVRGHSLLQGQARPEAS
jgi:hypothetical protein